jgi:hypothetical protein
LEVLFKIEGGCSLRQLFATFTLPEDMGQAIS